mmetsp:Transcript_97612/g.248018  ORF Transcript_97612/g.248018 Transcript_97612/m.248018 type:complete len:506 (-) Transcript_97612:50-1567(-)
MPSPGGRDDTEAHVIAWAVFGVVVGVLLAVDVTLLQTPLSAGRMSFQTAVKLTGFWVAAGLIFNLWVWSFLGLDAGVGFLQGFLLEYMLSFDNLFVFHLVFAYYCTPEALLYRALYFGIAGAIVLRVVFLAVGWTFMNSGVYFFKFVFGAILVWSGVRSANDLDDEGTADPTNNRCIAWVTKNLPVSDNYEPHGHFFITVAEVECRPPVRSASVGSWDEETSVLEGSSLRGPSGAAFATDGMGSGVDAPTTIDPMSGGLPRLESFEGSSLLDPNRNEADSLLDPSRNGGSSSRGPPGGEWPARQGSADFEVAGVMRKPARLKRKASLLLLVVIAVWVVDLVFAVDSVASKLASVSDVFLNCSSSAFAMLSLRSLYFIMESLTRTFQMLKYGISAILVLIGLKLVFSGWVDVPNGLTFVVILGIIAASVASSMWMPRLQETCERIEFGGGANGEEDELGSTFDRTALTAQGAAEPAFGGGSGGGGGGAGGGSSYGPPPSRSNYGRR